MNKSYIFFLFRNESSHDLHKILYWKYPEKSFIDYFHNFKIGGKKSLMELVLQGVNSKIEIVIMIVTSLLENSSTFIQFFY